MSGGIIVMLSAIYHSPTHIDCMWVSGALTFPPETPSQSLTLSLSLSLALHSTPSGRGVSFCSSLYIFHHVCSFSSSFNISYPVLTGQSISNSPPPLLLLHLLCNWVSSVSPSFRLSVCYDKETYSASAAPTANLSSGSGYQVKEECADLNPTPTPS